MMLAVPGLVEPVLGNWSSLFKLDPGADLNALISQRIEDGIVMILLVGAFVGFTSNDCEYSDTGGGCW